MLANFLEIIMCILSCILIFVTKILIRGHLVDDGLYQFDHPSMSKKFADLAC